MRHQEPIIVTASALLLGSGNAGANIAAISDLYVNLRSRACCMHSNKDEGVRSLNGLELRRLCIALSDELRKCMQKDV